MNGNDDQERTTEVRLSCWEEFEQKASAFDDPNRKLWDEVWFRGQADAQWPLLTTLERRSKKVSTVRMYLSLIREIKPAIETFTGAEFQMLKSPEIEERCRQYDLFHMFLFDVITYMAHLRHGAFPSPLLDWTGSPYVAAYFAFSRAKQNNGEVAIFAYRERPANMKIGGSVFSVHLQLWTIGKNAQSSFQTAIAIYDVLKVREWRMGFRAARERLWREGSPTTGFVVEDDHSGVGTTKGSSTLR